MLLSICIAEYFVSNNEVTFAHAITSSVELYVWHAAGWWYLRKALSVMNARWDLISWKPFKSWPRSRSSNLWKHRLLSAAVTQRERHVLHLLGELWKFIEHRVLVLKNQLSLYLRSDSNVNVYPVPLCGHRECHRCEVGCKLWTLVTSPPQVCSRSVHPQRPHSGWILKW